MLQNFGKEEFSITYKPYLLKSSAENLWGVLRE